MPLMQVKFTITVHDGCWDGFRFVKIQSVSDVDKLRLVTCADYWKVNIHDTLCPSTISHNLNIVSRFLLSLRRKDHLRHPLTLCLCLSLSPPPYTHNRTSEYF